MTVQVRNGKDLISDAVRGDHGADRRLPVSQAVTRCTWEPVGHTPVLCHRFNWKRASMAAAICLRLSGGGVSMVQRPPGYPPELNRVSQTISWNGEVLQGRLDQKSSWCSAA